MTVESGATWTGLIVTKDATGALAAPGVGPAGTLYINGTADAAAVAIAGANPYSWTVTLPALADGDIVSMYITATIGGIATASIVAEDIADAGYIWSSTTRTLTSFGTLVADITAAISAILCNVWACSTRTLTVGLSHLKTALLGTKIEMLRGDTLILNVTRLGDISARDNIWFTVKDAIADTDATAQIQVDEDTGLLYIDGGAATVAANGSITFTDAARGDITIRVEADEMAKLDPDFVGYFDIQTDTAGLIATLRYGNAAIIGDVTRATS